MGVKAEAVLNSKLSGYVETAETAILKNAESEARAKIDKLSEKSNNQKQEEQVLSTVVSGLKQARNTKSSLYDYLIVDLMRQLDPANMARFYRGIVCLSEKSDFFPKGFPFELRQKAESILIAKLKDVIGPREILDYLVTELKKKEIRQIEKDIAFATSQGVDGERFAGLMFELRKLSTSSTINELLLKKEIVRVLREKGSLTLIHIKSLRYTYPEGKKLKVLDHLEKVVSPGIGREVRIYPSEKVIFERLMRVIDLLAHYGIKTNLVILVAGNDLEILFPDGNSLVSQDEVRRARTAARRYIQTLKTYCLDLTEQTFLLTDYLRNYGLEEKYHSVVREVFRAMRVEGGSLVKNTLVEQRVNHQFEHYCEMFGPRYTRREARLTAYHQIANLMALSVVFESFSEIPIVMVDDRGQENVLVGGYQPDTRAIFFSQLKDKTIIKKNVKIRKDERNE